MAHEEGGDAQRFSSLQSDLLTMSHSPGIYVMIRLGDNVASVSQVEQF